MSDGKITFKKYYHIGVAVDTPKWLDGSKDKRS